MSLTSLNAYHLFSAHAVPTSPPHLRAILNAIPVVLNIRTEVEPFPGPDALWARARVVAPLGSRLRIIADVGDQPIKITAPADFPARPTGSCGCASTRPRCGSR